MVTLAGVPSLFRGTEMTGWIGSGLAAVAPGSEAYDAPPPTVSISIEPAALAPHAGADSPVILPGYLLPDDSGEESPHAGS
jgi:hypothetical protein